MDTLKRERIRQVAYWLDECIEIPYLRWRIGWEAVIGLIPGVGDVIGAALSMLLLRWAVAERIPWPIVARMLGNVLLELSVGLLPFLGDVFDFFWKANVRNARLLLAYVDNRPAVTRRAAWQVAAVLAAMFLLVAGVVYVFVKLLIVLWHALGTLVN